MGRLPTVRLLLSTAVIAAGLGLAVPSSFAQDSVDLRGLVVRDDLTGGQLERAVLRAEGSNARKYKTLSNLFVLKAPSEQAWNEVMAPALKAAMDSPRPIEALRSTMLGMGDSLLGSPSDSAVRMTFLLPGDRGEGVLGLTAPVLIGPSKGRTGHKAPNRMRVVTGIQANPVSGRDPVVVEAIGLPDKPGLWTGDALRLADLEAIPYGGEGAWVRYRGKMIEEDDEADLSQLEKLASRVIKLGEEDVLDVGRLATWPGRAGDEADLRDTLQSARYASRVLDVEERLVDELRKPESELVWRDKRIKHPTRFAVATLPVSAEVVVGRKLVERTEVFAFVYLYTPLFVPFNSAHLYLSVSPEVLVRSVQDGQLPFFLWRGKAYFYLGHLDRWLAGDALEPEGRLVSRKKIPDVIAQWAEDVDRKTAKDLRQRAEDSSGWPLRLVPRKDQSERAYKLRVSVQDLGNWFHRLRRSIQPRVGLSKPGWTVRYKGECAALDLGELFAGGKVVIEEGAGQVSALPPAAGIPSAGSKVTIEPGKSSGGRRDGAMSRESNVELRLKKVTVGTPAAGKPYLLTRAGRTVPVKVGYVTKSAGKGHKIRVVAQVYDPSGEAMGDFKSRSSSISLKEGEGAITTYLKVPKRLYRKSGVYRVRTHIELDGTALGGAREEFLYLGSALTMTHMELDPSVVIPGEEVLLLLDLAVAGWAATETVPLQVELSYQVAGTVLQDSFKISRSVGNHQLEVDLRVPDGLSEGDGTYKVVVSAASGQKASASGKIRVFARELVAADVGRQRRGLSLRVEDEDGELLAAAKAAKAANGGGDREVVRAERLDEGEDDLFGDVNLEDEPVSTPATAPAFEDDQEELVLVEEEDDLDLDFGEGAASERDEELADEEGGEDELSLDLDLGDDLERKPRSRTRSREEREEREEEEELEEEEPARPKKQRSSRSREREEREAPVRMSEAQRRREAMRRRQSSGKEGDAEESTQTTVSVNRRRSLEEERRQQDERRAEEARRSRERRRAEREAKEQERRTRREEREREQAEQRAEEARRSASRDKQSRATNSNRRRASQSSEPSRRRGPRGNSSSEFLEEEEDSFSWEEEEEGVSSGDEEDFIEIQIEEDDEEEVVGAAGRDAGTSPSRRGRGNSDSDRPEDSYWLSGSREDPDAADWGSGSEEDDLSEGRSVEGLPQGVYSEDAEANAVSRALREGMGVVWVYGGSETALKRWYALYEDVAADGSDSWVWIFSEGAGGGELRFKRFSSDRESWKTVYKVPSSKANRTGMRELGGEVIAVLEGYVPALDRKVPFGRF